MTSNNSIIIVTERVIPLVDFLERDFTSDEIFFGLHTTIVNSFFLVHLKSLK